MFCSLQIGATGAPALSSALFGRGDLHWEGFSAQPPHTTFLPTTTPLCAPRSPCPLLGCSKAKCSPNMPALLPLVLLDSGVRGQPPGNGV